MDGIGEAPMDDKQYTRKNGGWEEVANNNSEKVVLHISTNAGVLPTPMSIVVKRVDDDFTIYDLSWIGSDLTFLINSGLKYKIEYPYCSGFDAPSAFTTIAMGGTQRNVSPVYIYTGKGTFIGYTDGSTSSLSQPISEKTVKGVVLKTDNISICIHKTEGSSKTWSPNTSTVISGVTTETDRITAMTDYAGKANTDAVFTSGLQGTAFDWVRSEGRGNEWYLPACGEIEEIRFNLNKINTAMSKIGGAGFNFNNIYYWSSTQGSDKLAWVSSQYGNHWNNYGKGNNYSCRAVCAF